MADGGALRFPGGDVDLTALPQHDSGLSTRVPSDLAAALQTLEEVRSSLACDIRVPIELANALTAAVVRVTFEATQNCGRGEPIR